MRNFIAKLIALYLGIGKSYRIIRGWKGRVLTENLDFYPDLIDDFDDPETSFPNWYTFYPYGRPGELDNCKPCRSRPDSQSLTLDENAVIEDGRAILTAKPEPRPVFFMGTEYDYSAGVLFSRQTFHFGRYRSRVKFPTEHFHSTYWLWRVIEVNIAETGLPHLHPTQAFLTNVHGYTREIDGKLVWDTAFHEQMPRNFYFDDQNLHDLELLWTPLRLEWKKNGKVIRTVWRYHTLGGFPIKPGKKIRAKTIVENLSFPKDPMRIIHSIGLHESPVVRGAKEDSMYVEYSHAYTPKSYIDPETGKEISLLGVNHLEKS